MDAQTGTRSFGPAGIAIVDLETVGGGEDCAATRHVCNRRDDISDADLLGNLDADAQCCRPVMSQEERETEKGYK